MGVGGAFYQGRKMCFERQRLTAGWSHISQVILHNSISVPKPTLCPSPQYLGSMLIKDLRGTESTQDACAKMRVRWLSGSPESTALAALPETLGSALSTHTGSHSHP